MTTGASGDYVTYAMQLNELIWYGILSFRHCDCSFFLWFWKYLLLENQIILMWLCLSPIRGHYRTFSLEQNWIICYCDAWKSDSCHWIIIPHAHTYILTFWTPGKTLCKCLEPCSVLKQKCKCWSSEY